MVKAILFDLAGVLIDTESIHFQALNEVLLAHGLPIISEHEHASI